MRAILFDLDDTLYPESQFVRSGFDAVARWAEEKSWVSRKQGYARLVHLFESGIRRTTFNTWLGEIGKESPDAVAAAIAVYRSHEPDITLFPSVRPLLQRLTGRYRLGIVTDGNWETQARKISALGISEYFGTIILTERLGPDCGKPSPRPFIEAMRELGMETGGTACYVGDNAGKDFLGARKVGLHTVWVHGEGGLYSSVLPPTPEHGADVEIASIGDLEELLERCDANTLGEPPASRGNQEGRRGR